MTSCLSATGSWKKAFFCPNSYAAEFWAPSGEIDIKYSGLIPLKNSRRFSGLFSPRSPQIDGFRIIDNLSFYLHYGNSTNFGNYVCASVNDSENFSSENVTENNSIEDSEFEVNSSDANSSSNSNSEINWERQDVKKSDLKSEEGIVNSIKIAAVSLSIVLAAISISGTFSMAATAEVGEKTSKKKGATKRAPKTMGVDERTEWAKDLPIVNKKLPYTDIIELHKSRQLKYIVKHPQTVIKSLPDSVLLVLEDDEVVRTVLPPPERDSFFWSEWEQRKINDSVIDAYSPSLTSPTILPWGRWGPTLAWLENVAKFLRSKSIEIERREKKVDKNVAQTPLKPKVKKKEKKGKVVEKEKAVSSVKERIEELERAKKEIELARIEREKKLAQEKEERAKWEQAEKIRAQKQAKEEAKRKLRDEKLAIEDKERLKELSKKENRIISKFDEQERWNVFFQTAATNEMVRFGMGIGFFFFFYYGIVLNIKKRRKDYEDRMKILQAEEEERRKMREWEDNMTQVEIIVSAEESGLSEEEKKKLKEQEENAPQLQQSRRFLRSGASIRAGRGMRKRRPPQYMEMDVDVKFSDVAGLGEIRKELEEVVDFFTNAEKYRRRGSKIPSGILLCGGPGTGKTLLAKAVAGEAGVNFFSISASQFVQIYVGVGASRVRALYQEAKENAPAVVFIDELDAVGRKRGLTSGSGGQERDATLNQLLTCLDGFENKGEVITIAATNRIDILDPALIRPGRFDRKIFIPLPSFRGRQEILRVHSRDKPIAEDVDFPSVAGVAEGMSGAQLANVVDIATLRALREGRSQVETEDLLDAVQIERGGNLNPHIVSEERERQLALNESALVVVAYNFPELRNLSLVTVRPRMNDEKGIALYRGDLSLYKLEAHSKQRLLNIITVNTAPKIADEMINGWDHISTIWADSSDMARHMARSLVMQGMSDNPGLQVTYDVIKDNSRIEAVDVEAEKILNQCKAKAHDLLIRNRRFMDALIEELVEHKTIRGPKIAELASLYGDFDPLPMEPVEIREKNLAEFRESMIQEKRSARDALSDGSKSDAEGESNYPNLAADTEGEKIYVENK